MRETEFARPKDGGCLIDVCVTAGAWKTLFTGVRDDDRLKVAVNAPLEGGKANKELLRLFKVFFGECELVSGSKSRKKTVYIKNTGPKEATEKIINNI